MQIIKFIMKIQFFLIINYFLRNSNIIDDKYCKLLIYKSCTNFPNFKLSKCIIIIFHHDFIKYDTKDTSNRLIKFLIIRKKKNEKIVN